MTAMELGHDYLVLTDHSPRLRVANGLSAERLARQLGVVDAVNEHLGGHVHPAEGDRGRHPRRRVARPDPGDARPARRTRGVGALQAEDGEAAMTRRMIGAVRNPHTNVLGHCTGRLVTGNRGVRAAEPVRREGGLHGVRRGGRGGGDQLASGAARPADAAARAGPRPRLPVLHRLRRPRARASSTCSTTAPRGPPRRASTPTGSSPRGSGTGCWSGPRRGSDPRVPARRRRSGGARFDP